MAGADFARIHPDTITPSPHIQVKRGLRETLRIRPEPILTPCDLGRSTRLATVHRRALFVPCAAEAAAPSRIRAGAGQSSLPPMCPVPLLRHAADVTPEWLSDALAGAGVLAAPRWRRSRRRRSAPGRWPTPRASPCLSTDPGAGPASVVGKFASADDQSRSTGLALRAYEIEVRFYREVARRVGARVPAVYRRRDRAGDRMVHPPARGHRRAASRATRSRRAAPTRPRPCSTRWPVSTRRAGKPPTWPRLEWLNRTTPETDGMLTALVPSLLPGFLERYADTLAPEHQEVCRTLRRAPARLARPAQRAAHSEPRRLPARQPPLPAGQPRGRWSSTGRRWPGRGPPSTSPTSSAGASVWTTAAPTSPSCSRTTTTPSAVAACGTTRSRSCATTTAATPSPASSWPSWPPWSSSAPSAAT